MESGLTALTDGNNTASTNWSRIQAEALWKQMLRALPMTFVDFISLIVVFFLVTIIGARFAMVGSLNLQSQASHIAINATFVAASLILLWLMRIRDSVPASQRGFKWTQVVGVVSFASMLSALTWLMFSPGVFDQLYAVLVWTLSILILPLGEFSAHGTYRLVKLNSTHQTPVIIVGSDSSTTAVKERLEQEDGKYQLIGTVDLADVASNGQDFQTLSRAIDINSYAKTNGGLLVAAPANEYKRLQSIFDSNSINQNGRINVTLYPNIDTTDYEPDQEWKAKKFSWWYEKLKRGLDLTIALASLLLAFPLILLIAALIKLDSRGPLLFNQTRVGRNGQLFKMLKFRSMCADAENLLDDLADKNQASGQMFKIADDPRVTRVGKVIRRLSLDEIPQLLNVIKGEMSIVGPRPPLPHEVKEYSPWHFRRFEAKPGITGLWQVKRGSIISFDEMVQLDIDYIDNWNLGKDISILIETIPAMLRGQGAY